MNIAVISATFVVYELDTYITQNADVNHRTEPLPFRVSEAVFQDIHGNGCTRLTLALMVHLLGDRGFDVRHMGLIVRYVQGLIAMGDMAGYDFAGAVHDERAVHVAAAA
jgi:hypothetical protein